MAEKNLTGSVVDALNEELVRGFLFNFGGFYTRGCGSRST